VTPSATEPSGASARVDALFGSVSPCCPPTDTFDSMCPMRRHDLAGPPALRAMLDLAVRVFPETGYRHVGDLMWTWSLLHDQNDEHPTAFWAHQDRTVAWAWLDRSDNLLLQVDPAFPDLVDEVLDWALLTASGPVRVDVAGTERHLVAALGRRAHLPAADDSFVVAMGRGLSGLPNMPSLPPGYTMRTQQAHGDIAGRVAAHGAAFGSTRMTTERYARMTMSWPYQPEFDLCRHLLPR
jgi:hypothetical protein